MSYKIYQTSLHYTQHSFETKRCQFVNEGKNQSVYNLVCLVYIVISAQPSVQVEKIVKIRITKRISLVTRLQNLKFCLVHKRTETEMLTAH